MTKAFFFLRRKPCWKNPTKVPQTYLRATKSGNLYWEGILGGLRKDFLFHVCICIHSFILEAFMFIKKKSLRGPHDMWTGQKMLLNRLKSLMSMIKKTPNTKEDLTISPLSTGVSFPNNWMTLKVEL